MSCLAKLALGGSAFSKDHNIIMFGLSTLVFGSNALHAAASGSAAAISAGHLDSHKFMLAADDATQGSLRHGKVERDRQFAPVSPKIRQSGPRQISIVSAAFSREANLLVWLPKLWSSSLPMQIVWCVCTVQHVM